jgi:hypothetical protein
VRAGYSFNPAGDSLLVWPRLAFITKTTTEALDVSALRRATRLTCREEANAPTRVAALAKFRSEAIKNSMAAVNRLGADRVSVAAPKPARAAAKPDQVVATLVISAK